MKYLKDYLDSMRNALIYTPSPALIYAAKWAITEIDRKLLPDWIEALANGAPDMFDAVLEIVLADLQECDNGNYNDLQ